MGGMGDGPSRSHLVPGIPTVAPVPDDVRAYPLLMNAVDCLLGVGALLAAAM